MQFLLFACVSSLAVGLADTLLSLVSSPWGFQPLGFAMVGFGASAAATLGLYLMVLVAVALHLSRAWRLDRVRLAASLGLFSGSLLRLATLQDLLSVSVAPSFLLRWGEIGLVALALSGILYWALSTGIHQGDSARPSTAMAALLVPWFLAEGVLFLASRQARPGPFLSIPGWAPILSYALVIPTGLWAIRGASRRRAFVRGVVLLGACLAIPIAARTWTSLPKGNAADAPRSTHKIVLIVVDTLRRDAVGCMGSGASLTPRIDELAQDGIAFDRAVSSAPWTLASVSSIMTGVSPRVHQVKQRESDLPRRLHTLAERLSGAGYRTAGIGCNVTLSRGSHMDQGFQEFSFLERLSAVPVHAFGCRIAERLFPEAIKLGTTSDMLTAGALSWLKKKKDQDFFLWVHYLDPHLPYAPPEEFAPTGDIPASVGHRFERHREIRSGSWTPTLSEREWIKRIYDGEVRYVDQAVGHLLDAMKSLGVYDDSLIILTSDHGEEFWEHGQFEHGHSLYGELLNVPLILKLPFDHPWKSSGLRCSQTVPIEGLTATTLELAGIPFQGDEFTSGSFASLMESPGPQSSTILTDGGPCFGGAVLWYEDRVCVTFNGLKYIRSLVTGREELYDLTQDPGETTSIAESDIPNLERARQLMAEREAMCSRLWERWGIVQGGVMDRDRMKKLKDLGYM